MNSDMLQSYSVLLDTLKENILKNFINVEFNLIELINSNGSSISSISPEKKHNLNVIIMDILTEYSNINMSMEKINNNLKVEINKNIVNSSPERDHVGENMSLNFESHRGNPFMLNSNPFDTFVENIINKSDEFNKNDDEVLNIKETSILPTCANETLFNSDVVSENNKFVESEEIVICEGFNKSDDQALELKEINKLDTRKTDNNGIDDANEQNNDEISKSTKSQNQILIDSDFTKTDKVVENVMNKSEESIEMKKCLDLKEIFKTSKLHRQTTLFNIDDTEIYIGNEQKSNENVIDENAVGEDLEENKSEPEVPSKLIAESAVTKLENMNINDRIAEAMKKFDKEILPENFGFVTTDPNEGTTNVKIKRKRKVECYQVENSKLEINDVCTVVCVDNPSNFYVTLDTALLFQLNDAINEEYNNAVFHVAARHKNKNKAKVALGDYGVAYILEKCQWFRVEILDWFMIPTDQKLDEKVLVRLIDFGEEYLIYYNSIHSLNQTYANFPKMAIKCHLAELFPFNEQHPNVWSTEAINEFKCLTKDQKFVIIHQYKENDSYAIDLCHQSSSDERSISQILKEKNLAFDRYEDAQAEQTKNYLEMDGDELEFCENLNEAIAGYDAQDEAQTCKFINKHGACYKGPKCKLKHVKVTSSGITTDTVLTVQTTFREQEFPEIGSFISILITECSTVTEFSGQIIIGSRKHIFNKNFDKLFNRMNSDEINGSYRLYRVYPSGGEIIIAKYANTYFRARFLQHINDQECLVFLVDIGSEVRVTFSSIFHMQEEFMYLPIQAFKFRIQSCRQKANIDQAEVKKFIDTSISFKHFTACVKSAVEPIVVQLWDLKDMDMSYVLDQMSFIDTNVENLSPSTDSYLQLM